MIDQCIHGIFAAVDEVNDAGRKAHAFDQFENAPHRHRSFFGRLQHDGVSARNGIRQKPERDHSRKVKRGDDADNPDGLAYHHFIHTRTDVLEIDTHYERWNARGHFDILDTAPELTFGFRERLAALIGDEACNLLD